MYKALDLTTDEWVAIKVVSLVDQPGDHFLQIQKEITLLSSCNHPNVVRYYVRQCRQHHIVSSQCPM